MSGFRLLLQSDKELKEPEFFESWPDLNGCLQDLARFSGGEKSLSDVKDDAVIFSESEYQEIINFINERIKNGHPLNYLFEYFQNLADDLRALTDRDFQKPFGFSFCVFASDYVFRLIQIKKMGGTVPEYSVKQSEFADWVEWEHVREGKTLQQILDYLEDGKSLAEDYPIENSVYGEYFFDDCVNCVEDLMTEIAEAKNDN